MLAPTDWNSISTLPKEGAVTVRFTSEISEPSYSTAVQHGEIPLGTLSSMLKDLNIPRREF